MTNGRAGARSPAPAGPRRRSAARSTSAAGVLAAVDLGRPRRVGDVERADPGDRRGPPAPDRRRRAAPIATTRSPTSSSSGVGHPEQRSGPELAAARAGDVVRRQRVVDDPHEEASRSPSRRRARRRRPPARWCRSRCRSTGSGWSRAPRAVPSASSRRRRRHAGTGQVGRAVHDRAVPAPGGHPVERVVDVPLAQRGAASRPEPRPARSSRSGVVAAATGARRRPCRRRTKPPRAKRADTASTGSTTDQRRSRQERRRRHGHLTTALARRFRRLPRWARMTDATDRADRELDLVLFGATGFTGRLTAEYLARHAPDGLRWGAGRPQRGEARGRARAPHHDRPGLADLPLLHADVDRRRLAQGRRPRAPAS